VKGGRSEGSPTDEKERFATLTIRGQFIKPRGGDRAK
jgi:hypothetical protein